MDEQLLVRAYSVGLGDCIYVRVPDGGQYRHILIDFGNVTGKESVLQAALNDVKEHLKSGRLDLLVATHPDKDHVCGFKSEWFQDVQVGQVWLSAGLDAEHPPGKKMQLMRALAMQALETLNYLPGVALSPALSGLVQDLWSAKESEKPLDVLRTLPAKRRLYVHDKLPPKQLRIFTEPATKLHVLAPAEDIDGEYLGKGLCTLLANEKELGGLLARGEDLRGLLANEERLSRLVTVYAGLRSMMAGVAPAPAPGRGAFDEGIADGHIRRIKARGLNNQDLSERGLADLGIHIGLGDFRRLRQRLVVNILAFTLGSSFVDNNISIVLLLEWRGRRLLFAGDAMYDGNYEPGGRNGSWEVMWHHHSALLKQGVDFFKVGHHGSHNGAPWSRGKYPEVDKILDALTFWGQEGAQPRTDIVVSTGRVRTNSYRRIPGRNLMEELGKRDRQARRYRESQQYAPSDFLDDETGDLKDTLLVPDETPQPRRTDLEPLLTDRPWVEVKLPPAD